jgi:hypothetical protein
LAKISTEFNTISVNKGTDKAAIWIVTDNATFDQPGILVDGLSYRDPNITRPFTMKG